MIARQDVRNSGTNRRELMKGFQPGLRQLSVMAKHDLEDRLVQFGKQVCTLGDKLPKTSVGQHVGLQLARSSTSAFANYGEVQSAESRRDFIHKLSICLKELRETRTWLKFVHAMDLASGAALAGAMQECDELLAIIASSIRTARRNGNPKNENVQRSLIIDD